MYVAGTPDFDFDAAWSLSDRVALRREPFGALAYDFRSRRLSFLKDPLLADVVRALPVHGSARATCDALGVPTSRQPAFERALAALARSRMIEQIGVRP